MTTVSEIKEKYPNPRKFNLKSRGYCVGGAVCLFVDNGERNAPFPDDRTLATYLEILNQNLPRSQAINFADFITTHNEHGEFKKAWAWVETALNYKEEAHE